jgi:hypothetical protein
MADCSFNLRKVAQCICVDVSKIALHRWPKGDGQIRTGRLTLWLIQPPDSKLVMTVRPEGIEQGTDCMTIGFVRQRFPLCARAAAHRGQNAGHPTFPNWPAVEGHDHLNLPTGQVLSMRQTYANQSSLPEPHVSISQQ